MNSNNNIFTILRIVTAIEVLLPYVNIDMIDNMGLDIICDTQGNISRTAVNAYARKRVRWVENTYEE